MPPPLAYYLTWSTYGTRLRGDARGTVDRDHNILGEPLLPPSKAREDAHRRRMKFPLFVMTHSQRAVVDRAVRDHCNIRSWRLIALNVRTNHGHVVVDCGGRPAPEVVLSQFKSWATRRLRMAELVPREGTLWTDHGSTRWINNSSGLAGAIEDVTNAQ